MNNCIYFSFIIFLLPPIIFDNLNYFYSVKKLYYIFVTTRHNDHLCDAVFFQRFCNVVHLVDGTNAGVIGFMGNPRQVVFRYLSID